MLTENATVDSKTSTPNVEAAKRAIDALDFSNIINKMVTRDGWLRCEAEKVSQLYRHFLFLMFKYRSTYHFPLAPSEEIDEFWHQHILDTQAYRRDCQIIFGEYVDHYPYFGSDEKSNFSDLEKAFEITRQLHRDEFGYELYAVRTIYSPIIARLKCLFRSKPKAAE